MMWRLQTKEDDKEADKKDTFDFLSLMKFRNKLSESFVLDSLTKTKKKNGMRTKNRTRKMARNETKKRTKKMSRRSKGRTYKT